MTAVRDQGAEQRYPHRHLDVEGPVAARPGMRVGPRRDQSGEPEAEPAEDDGRAVGDEPDLGCRRETAHPQFHRAEPLSGPFAGAHHPSGEAGGTEGADPLLVTRGPLRLADDAQPCRQPRRGRGQPHQPPQHPGRRGAPPGDVHDSGGCRGDGAGVKPAYPVITVRHRRPRLVASGHGAGGTRRSSPRPAGRHRKALQDSRG